MPESTTEVPHVAATHHRIGIHPAQARTIEDTADSRELSELFDVDWESESDRQRGFGLAYLAASKEQSERRSSEEYRRIATLQLQSAYDAGIHDSDVACGLATALLPTAPDRALRLAEVVLQETEYTTETRIDALWIAATVRMQRRQLNEAIPVLRELTLLRRQGADWFQLAACLHALGRNEDAIEIAERAVAIRPAVAVYRELLASIYASVDRQEDAEEQYALARELVQ